MPELSLCHESPERPRLDAHPAFPAILPPAQINELIWIFHIREAAGEVLWSVTDNNSSLLTPEEESVVPLIWGSGSAFERVLLASPNERTTAPQSMLSDWYHKNGQYHHRQQAWILKWEVSLSCNRGRGAHDERVAPLRSTTAQHQDRVLHCGHARWPAGPLGWPALLQLTSADPSYWWRGCSAGSPLPAVCN